VEFTTPLSHDEERIDACYDGEPLRYRMMKDLLGDQPVTGLVPHDLEGQWHLACDDGEPRSFTEAEKDAAWRAAMKAKMDAIEKNRTWELTDLPRGHHVITLKWVFKLKRNEVSAIIKHKARLVAQGFLQRKGIDFDDAFAPVARIEPCNSSLRWLPRRVGVSTTWTLSRRDSISPIRRARCCACARPSMACGWHQGHGMLSWISRSGGWALSKARTRRSSIGGAMKKMSCWWASTSTTW
jgi:hypothetical protein